MNKFDRMHGGADSSDDDQVPQYGQVPQPKSMVDELRQKNQILMERMIKV